MAGCTAYSVSSPSSHYAIANMLQKREKIALGVGVVLVLAGFVAGVTGFLKGLDASREGSRFSDEMVEAFQETLTDRALESGLFPIEGFDAYLLLDAYPGLQEADFDGVASLEGFYYYKLGALRYERRVEQPITSAEQTIATEGYGILLEHITDRLAFGIVDQDSLDILVDQLKQPIDG